MRARRAVRLRWAATVAGALALAGAAAAAPPVPPHSVASLPSDDGVILDGYDPAGGPVTVDLMRGAVRVATTGPLAVPPSGTVEINHLGSPDCWQAITPDVTWGDVVRVTQGAVVEESRVRNITVQSAVQVDADTVQVHGTGETALDFQSVEVRLINPAFQGLGFGGGPFIRTPNHGLVTANPIGSLNWVATFNFDAGVAAAAVQASLDADAEAGWASPDLAEATDVAAGAPGGPAQPDCTAPAGAYAAVGADPGTLTSATTSVVIDGVARPDASTVGLTVDDANPLTAPVVVAPQAIPAPPADRGGATWQITIPAGDLDTLDNGSLSVTPTFSPAPPVTPVGLTVTKDRGPGVLFTAGPANGSHVPSSSAVIGFAGTHPATFECSLDAAPFGACASPLVLTGLADGAHAVRVRGNDGVATGATATRSWTVDTVAPVTTILSGPPASTRATSATIGLSANEAGAGLQCSLDGAPFAACGAAYVTEGLAAGPHTLSARAVDLAGNVGPTAVHAWTVDRTAPAFVATIPGLRTTGMARTGLLRLAGRCVNERCTVGATVRVRVPAAVPGGRVRTFTLTARPVRLAAGVRGLVQVRLNAVQLRAVRQSLRAGRNVRVFTTMTGTDLAGNRAVRLPSFFLTPAHL